MTPKGAEIMENEQTRFTMRIDKAIFEKVKEHAVKNKRSAVKEIEFILEKYFEDNEK